MKSLEADVIIIGAGMSGLACGITLKNAGISPLVIEASPRTGGRVATDTVYGFRIDRGFQILLTAYPEVQRFVDMEALELGKFQKGAHIWDGDDWQKFYDPRACPFSALPAFLKQNVFTPKDCFLLMRLWKSFWGKNSLEALMGSGNRRTHVALEEMGFSQRAREVFFEPFLGGVFLDWKLLTSEKMFRFVMNMFIQGQATLPSGGMKHIPEQLTVKLGIENIRCESQVVRCDPTKGEVETADGLIYKGRTIIIATDGHAAHLLLPDHIPSIPFNHTRSFAFGIRKSYTEGYFDRTLRLVADPESPVQVIAAVSNVAAGYAPPEHDQVVVTLKDGIDADITADETLEALEPLYGKSVGHWHLLADYAIPHALPRQLPADLRDFPKYQKIGDKAWICGDYLETRSLNGALASGRLVAEQIIAERLKED